MLNLSNIRLDTSKLTNGVWWRSWFDPSDAVRILGEPTSDASQPQLLIVPAGNAFQRARDEASLPLLPKLRDRSITNDDLWRQIAPKVLARTVWRGAQNISLNVDGVEAEFVWTEESAEKLLADKSMLSLVTFIEAASNLMHVAAAEEEEKAKGN